MTRTTFDLDDAVLQSLKERKKREGKSMGAIASELLAQALVEKPEPPADLRWHSDHLGLRVDLEDKEALWAALEGP